MKLDCNFLIDAYNVVYSGPTTATNNKITQNKQEQTKQEQTKQLLTQ